MTAKLKKDRIEQILRALKKATAGDYSQKLDFASKDDDLGQIADAVNKLLKKSEKGISDSRQTAANLNEDARRYRHILDNIEESYFEVDLKGNLFFVNDTVVRDLGYSQEDLYGINFTRLVDEVNAKKVYEAFHQVFLTGQAIKGFDWEILKKNKEKIDVESSVALLRDETGKPVGFRGVVRNISERVQAQNDLRQSEEKYRTILDIMDEGYLEQDLAGTITFANDAACRLMGYERDQLIGKHYRDYLTPEVAGKMKEVFQKIYSTGKPARLVDYDIVRSDRSVVTYELDGVLRYDSSGKPCGFRVLIRDVSLRKRAEEAKRLSEEKYRIILEIMGEGYFETDSRGAITFVNDAGCNLAERGREELIGTNYDPYSTPESMNRINEAYRSIYRSDAAKMTLDYDVIRKDGSVGTHQQNVALLHDEAGRPKGFRVLVRDVTERKKAEDALRESEGKYRTILEDMDEIYLETDLRGNFIFFNDSFCRVVGYSREELQNANYRLIIPPGQTRNLFKMFYEIYRTGQKRTFVSREIMIKDGSTIYLEMSISLKRSPAGEPIGFSGISRDVTPRIKAERIIQDREKRLRLITDNISDIIWTMDFNLRWTYLSPSVLQMTGFSPAEVMRIPLKAMLPTETYALIEHDLDKELAKEARGLAPGEQRKTTFEMPLMRKNGTRLWVEISADFSRDENGKPLEIVGVTRDISERKNAEYALKESEKRYRTMTENVNDIVWTIDFNLQITYVSPSNIRLTGYTPEEVQNKPLDNFVATDSLAFAAQVLSDELARETGGEPMDPNRSTTLQIEVRAKNGENVWLEVNATFNRDANGKATEILAVGRNITQRRNMEKALAESEKRYRIMAETINDIIWTIDMNLQITYVSPSCTRITGYSQEESRRIPLDQLLTLDSFARATQRLAAELAFEASGRPFDPNRAITLEIEAIHKVGGTVWLEITGTFNRNTLGEITEILVVGRDITERKRAEQALEDSEKLYRMIVETMQDVIWIMDFNLQYKYRSPSSMRITGYTADEIMSIPPQEQMTPESYALAQEILLEELQREQSGLPIDPYRSRTMELEIYKKGGGTAWIEVTATFNRDREGKPFEILLAARDISVRKAIEYALRESEQRYRMIVENMQDVIGIMDFNFQFTYVSNDNLQLTGYTKEEVKDVPVDKLLTPGSLSLITHILAEELEREKKRTTFNDPVMKTLELELFHKAGGTTWAEVTATLVRDQYGKPKEILLVARDITARRKIQEALKESEQRYRMIIETMQEVIWTTDLNMQHTYMSPSCFLLTGYTPDELMILPLDQLLTPESLVTATNVVMEELARETGAQIIEPYRSRTIEQEIRCKNGETIWIEVTGTFIRDAKGKVTGMLMAGRDITASKKSREEKNKLEVQLMQAQKMEIVGRLAGGVAHDFNNMLSVILGYVDLAKLRLARQHPVLKDIAEIEKAAIRSRDITTQLLAFSRKQIIEPKVIDLNDLVAHTQKALTRLIGEDIGLQVVLGENLWLIKFDPSQIEQILINLAVNARDAMIEGGRLTIETVNAVLDDSYCEKNIDFVPGQYVRLSFSDDGVGMDKETLQHIFEPFFTTKEVGKGTGLGLATVYGIVKQNSGFVNVYSEPAHGTTFSIYLPRTQGESDLPVDPEEEAQIVGAGNILLVEDDAMVLQITRGILESIGYTVESTGNPADAVEYCKNPDACIDLVITDVVMPGISGKELRKKLVEMRPDINVIFMSGYTADVIAQHGVLEDGVQFIQKPFTIKSLAAKVAEALAAKKQA